MFVIFTMKNRDMLKHWDKTDNKIKKSYCKI